jgi:hypothetical protein
MKIKLLVTIITCLTFFNVILGQKNETAFGVRYSGDFGIIYKQKIKEDKFWRLTAGNIAFQTQTNLSQIIRFGGALSFENSHLINEKFNIINGSVFIVNNSSIIRPNFVTLLEVGYGYMIGAQYFIKPNVSIEIELIPSARQSINISKEKVELGTTYTNFSMNGANINLVYWLP